MNPYIKRHKCLLDFYFNSKLFVILKALKINDVIKVNKIKVVQFSKTIPHFLITRIELYSIHENKGTLQTTYNNGSNYM